MHNCIYICSIMFVRILGNGPLLRHSQLIYSGGDSVMRDVYILFSCLNTEQSLKEKKIISSRPSI